MAYIGKSSTSLSATAMSIGYGDRHRLVAVMRLKDADLHGQPVHGRVPERYSLEAGTDYG